MVLTGALLSFPSLLSGLPGDQDGPLHVSYQQSFTAQFWSGDLYPRWLAGPNGGLGSPVLYIMYPLPYFAAALVSPLLPDVAGQQCAAVELGVVAGLAMIGSGLAMFLWLRGLTAIWPAVFGSVAYMALPYHFAVDFYNRSAIGEHVAFVWPPLLMLFSERMTPRSAKAVVGFAVVWALLLMSHLFTAIMFFPIAAAYLFALRPRSEWVRSGTYLAIATALGLGLAGVYLVPLVFHQPFFDHRLLELDASNTFDYHNHFGLVSDGFQRYSADLAARLHITTTLLGALAGLLIGVAVWIGVAPLLFGRSMISWIVTGAIACGGAVVLCLPLSSPLWLAAGMVRDVPHHQDVFVTKVFITTLSTVLILVAGLLAALKENLRLTAVLALAGAGAFFMTLPISELIWDAIPAMSKLDFPWRFTTVITFSAAVVVAVAVNRFLQMKRRTVTWLAGALCITVAAFCGLNAALLNVQTRFLNPHRYESSPAADVMLNTYAKSTPADWVRKHHRELAVMPFVAATSPGAQTSYRRIDARHIEVQVTTAVDATVRVKQLYYPAWRATSIGNGQQLDLLPSNPEGFLQFPVDAGAHRVLLQFLPTDSEFAGVLTSVISLILLVGVLVSGLPGPLLRRGLT